MPRVTRDSSFAGMALFGWDLSSSTSLMMGRHDIHFDFLGTGVQKLPTNVYSMMQSPEAVSYLSLV